MIIVHLCNGKLRNLTKLRDQNMVLQELPDNLGGLLQHLSFMYEWRSSNVGRKNFWFTIQ